MDLSTLAKDIQDKAAAIVKTRADAIKAQAALDEAQAAYVKSRQELASLQADLQKHLTALTTGQ